MQLKKQFFGNPAGAESFAGLAADYITGPVL
jgi:hypothetical protein